MLAPVSVLANFASQILSILASPAPVQQPLAAPALQAIAGSMMYKCAHRGGRGNTVENSLPSFAWGLIDGAATLELDNGITKEAMSWSGTTRTLSRRSALTLCLPYVAQLLFPNDPDFPYVGKYIANLTLAQLKTLDCGSKRQDGYPMQLTYPGTRISTMQEVFDFVDCADPEHKILRGGFVKRQHALFSASAYASQITYQSFDWRTLIAMKALDPEIPTSALIDDDTAWMPDNSTTPWLAGLRLDSFPGPTIGHRVAQAARSIDADILSPSARSFFSPALDPAMEDYATFTTKEMVDEAHKLDISVKVWTVNRLNIVEQMLAWKVDGIITDYPDVVRRLTKQYGYPSAPTYPKHRYCRV
ncbi:PLC-like phosphodiesterase [Fomitopsis serialis]|uniref:PLC-like phosphodiesterase n=1 Tax=Fomitopsis serialis TaxID=139415 RepID=UPI0020079C79|nr:PLC-like phosphodiesterase [Neoantrodia serialis]KAH9919122.1 PLC-like phosphodiesterase [Neoantrodia serialis]